MIGTMESGCICQSCKELYTVDIIIPDNIWEDIKPRGKPPKSGMLCPKCIGERIEKIHGFACFQLKKED